MPRNASLGYSSANKVRRQVYHIAKKKSQAAAKRERNFNRKKDEAQTPELREERRARNVPHTIDSKRKWDRLPQYEEDLALGHSVNLFAQPEGRAKRRRTDDEMELNLEMGEDVHNGGETAEADSDTGSEPSVDSLFLTSDSDSENDDDDDDVASNSRSRSTSELPPESLRAASPATSTTSTRLDLIPDFLREKFPSLFVPVPEPKVLVTTSLNSNLHTEARLLATLFPNSTYVRRSAHRFAHKFSVREISRFAANRGFTALVVLNEDQKRPCGLDIVHLPAGPMFHFTLTNWVEGRRLSGHGNPTNHNPELILNNFCTPLGLLTAHVFQSLFPSAVELEGRQIVTLHNQRDYIFVRRHRYVFRDKRPTEKSVVGTDGKPVRGVEGIRAGLQELGPRFTLKLRRVDRGIQRASGQEWEWKSKMERDRTKFQL